MGHGRKILPLGQTAALEERFVEKFSLREEI